MATQTDTPDLDPAALAAEVERLRQEVKDAEAWRVNVINTAQGYADNATWCGDFDNIMAKCHLPKRRTQMQAIIGFRIGVPIRNATEAGNLVNTADGRKRALEELIAVAQDLLGDEEELANIVQAPGRFVIFQFVDTQNRAQPYTAEDLIASPMKINPKTGKPLLRKPAKT